VDRYGWEEDGEKLWLSYFNRSLFASGVITEEEFQSVEAVIANVGSLKPQKRHSIMNRS